MPEKRAIKTDRAAPPIGPYNQGVRWDRLIFTASVPTSNPQFGPAPEGDVAAAARTRSRTSRRSSRRAARGSTTSSR